MTIRIGYIGDEAICDAVRPLLPTDAAMEMMSIADATRAVASGELTVLIVAPGDAGWQDMLDRLSELHEVAATRPVAAFALLPRNDAAAMQAAFDYHVADFAGLPIDPDEVRVRLASLVRRRKVARARAAETRAAWQLAVIDPVTGLYNRHHLDSTLPAAISGARVAVRPLSLLMVDIDALKPFNDRWGHGAGDLALRAVADALKANLRASDTVARYGGDEIAVVLPDTDIETARSMATRLLDAVAAVRIGQAGESMPTPAGDGACSETEMLTTGLGVTVSIGVAALAGREEARGLLARADKALYAAKRSGRNRVAAAV